MTQIKNKANMEVLHHITFNMSNVYFSTCIQYSAILEHNIDLQQHHQYA